MADYTLSVDGRFQDGITGRLNAIQKTLGGVADGLGNAGKSAVSFGSMLKANVIGNVITNGLNAVAGAVGKITGSLKGMAGELQSTSATWSNFEQNLAITGSTAEEIDGIKKELQDFAEQTVYSASDMASTYAQLNAVGVKNTKELVKGFGGLAASAADPAQAMKSLSLQMTQAAAKPTIAYQDFKVLLEQMPAGVAAVAKEMGMSTSELVQAVQDGEIATQDFFDAITRAGNSDAYQEMATKPKTVAAAMDGLKEAVQNRLLPAFENLQSTGIDAIQAIADGFSAGGIEGAIDALSGKIGEIMDNLDASAGISGFMNSLNGAIGKLMEGFNNNLPKFIRAGGEIINGLVVGISKNLPTFLEGIKTLATSILETIQNNAPGLMQAGSQIIETITSAITENLPTIIETAASLISNFLTGIGEHLPEIMDTAMTILQQLIDGFTQNLPMVIDAALTIIQGLTQGFVDNIDQFIAGAVQLLGGIIDAVEQAGPTLLEAAGTIIMSLINGLINHLPELIEMGLSLINSLVDGIVDHIDEIVDATVQITNSLVNTLIENLPMILEGAGKIITALVTGLLNNLPEILEGAMEIMTNLTEAIIDHLPEILETGIEIIGELVVGIIEATPKIVEAIPKIFTKMVDKFASMDWLQIGKDIIGGIKDGIIEAGGAIWDSLKETVGGAVDKVKSFFGIASPSKLMRDEVGQYLPKGVGAGITEGTPSMLADVEKMNDRLYAAISADYTGATSGADYGATTNNYGASTVNMNVYGAEGQSEERLAAIITNRIYQQFEQEGRVFA